MNKTRKRKKTGDSVPSNKPFEQPPELKILWKDFDVTILPSCLVVARNESHLLTADVSACVIPVSMLGLLESSIMGRINGEILLSDSLSYAMKSAYQKMIWMMKKYTLMGANRMAHASKAFFASCAATMFEEQSQNPDKALLSEWNLKYGAEVREEAINRCKIQGSSSFVEEFESICKEKGLNNCQVLDLVGITTRHLAANLV